MNKKSTGFCYERKAAEYLLSCGCNIIERNYRCKAGEIDLVVRDGSYLVFVEVKYRSTAVNGYGSEAVDFRKQTRIRKAAVWYMKERHVPPDQPCRFDVISFFGDEISIVKDAFQCV